MIKIEHNTLVLDSSHTKNDQKAVNDFIVLKVLETKTKIISELDRLEIQSQGEDLIKRVREIVEKTNQANKDCSSIPMAEEVDLKSIQCQFESDLEHTLWYNLV